MTTSSNRLLLSIPLAALVAAAMAVALSIVPHPFGFHAWPKAPRSIERVVRVAPHPVPVAFARREAAEPRRSDAVAQHADRPRADRRARVPAGPRRSARQRASGWRHSDPTPAPGRSPALRDGRGDDAPVTEAPDGAPMAETPGPHVPPVAEAKQQARPPAAPAKTVGPGPGIGYPHHGQGPRGRGGGCGHRH